MRRTRRLDNPIVSGRWKPLLDYERFHGGASGNLQFIWMPAIKMNVHTTRSQDLCDQQPEFAITKYGNNRSLWNGRLIQNLTCRRERLNENGFLIGNRIGNHMQIHLRQSQEYQKNHNIRAGARDRCYIYLEPTAE